MVDEHKHLSSKEVIEATKKILDEVKWFSPNWCCQGTIFDFAIVTIFNSLETEEQKILVAKAVTDLASRLVNGLK